MIAANVAPHHALSETLAGMVASQVANIPVFDAWVVALLIWAGISAVLTIGFVLIVPITAARDIEKRSRKNATVSDRTPPH